MSIGIHVVKVASEIPYMGMQNIVFVLEKSISSMKDLMGKRCVFSGVAFTEVKL